MVSFVRQLTWCCNRVIGESQLQSLSREICEEICEHPCVIQLELPHWVSHRVPSTINHRAHLGQKILSSYVLTYPKVHFPTIAEGTTLKVQSFFLCWDWIQVWTSTLCYFYQSKYPENHQHSTAFGNEWQGWA